MNFLKKHGTTLLLTLVCLIGVGLIAYPSVADYYNSWLQRNAISDYASTVVNMDDDRYDEIYTSAKKYNKNIAKNGFQWAMSKKQKKEYNNQLKIDDSSAMGYIEIKKINEKLVIYHGTSAKALRTGVGHMEGTSLPIGGKTTHCVLSGHRGLPSAKLFSDLDKLAEGDTFVLHVLNLTLTYEVDQIRVVNPDDLTALTLEKGKDYCTLVTCTPYGVNTHRLLVRGHRVPNSQGDANVVADALIIEPIYIAPFLGVPVLILLIIAMLIYTGRVRRHAKSRLKEQLWEELGLPKPEEQKPNLKRITMRQRKRKRKEDSHEK